MKHITHEEEVRLKTNDLSKLTVRTVEVANAYSNQILWGVCAVLLVSAGVVYWYRSSAATEASAWTSLALANSAAEYAQVATDFPGSSAAGWARLREAEGLLAGGVRDAFSNREKAVTDLKRAREILEGIVANRAYSPDIRERGQMALARCLETLSDGNLGPAIAAYEALVKEFPDSPSAPKAAERAKVLGTAQAQSFYAWFAKQNPKPEEPAKPADKGPADPASSLLPGLPGHLGLPSPNAPGATPSEPADKPKSATDTPAPAEKPAEASSPATPGTSEKPAPAEKPAEKPAEPPTDKPAPTPEKPGT